MSRQSGLRGLPRAVLIVLVGGIVNAFGTGMVIPFFGIFLREGAGLSISRAGVVLAVFGLSGIVATPIVGWLSDRAGPKRSALLLLLLATIGFATFVFVTGFVTALAAAMLAGVGNGAFWTAQSTLLTALTNAQQRTVVFAASRAAMNLGVGIGGVVGGFIAVNGRPSTYHRLFVIDAVTFLAFAAIIATIVVQEAPPAAAHEPAPSFRAVFAHPFFRRLLAIDLATAVTFSLAFELLPIHSVGSLGLTNRIVGVFFLLNTLAVAGLQLPMVRVLAGRRRMSAYQIMHLAYAVGLFAILAAAGATHNVRIVLLGAVMVVLGVAETVYGAVRPAIVTELFPPAVMGRAFGVSTSLFNIGMAASRAGGAALLDLSDRAPWIVGGLICVAATLASRRLDATIPVASSRNPPTSVSPA